MIKVSVILPVYNSKACLAEAIESVLTQSLTEIELILINDGSTDGSGSICDSYKARDSRVKVLHKENGGICSARNSGLALARGEYLAFADHDDICLPGWLKENYEAAQKVNADIIKFGRLSEWIDYHGNITARNIRDLENSVLDKNGIRREFFKLRDKGTFSPVWDGLYKRSLVTKNNIQFDPIFKMGEEDTLFCLKCLSHASCLMTRSGVYYKHYIRKGKSTSSIFKQESLDKFVRSGIYEHKILQTLKPAGIKEQYLNSHIQNHIYPLVLSLMEDNCTWTFRKKTAYLNNIYPAELKLFTNNVFWKASFKNNPRNTLTAVLFRNRCFSLLLFTAWAYKKVLNFKQKKNTKNL